MKLLIFTQKVDKTAANAGYFHDWLLEFSKNCESVIVIALEVGEYDLPENVKVLSLGKLSGESSFSSRLKYVSNFYSYMWSERKNYTDVFVHMNQIYVVLGGLLWQLMNKKIGLWYVHRQVSFSLRFATFFADIIFTASKQSFRLPSSKVRVVGHGINPAAFEVERAAHDVFKVITVGRITRIKNLETFIEAASLLKKEGLPFKYEIIGPKVNGEDVIYMHELEDKRAELGLLADVAFIGSVANNEIGRVFAKSDLNINLAPSGGIDKVVLEGALAGAIPLVANTAFEDFLGEYQQGLLFEYGNAEDLAAKIKALYLKTADERKKIADDLKNKVKTEWSLEKLIKKILTYY